MSGWCTSLLSPHTIMCTRDCSAILYYSCSANVILIIWGFRQFHGFYRVFFFYVSKLILNKNLSKLKYLGLVFCILLCEICGFVTYFSFECEVPGLCVLYSQTKMLKLRKPQTLHQKTPHFLQQWALMIGHFFVKKSKNIFVALSFLHYF